MELYFSATPNLFDGMEMLEVLLQDKNNVIDEGMKIAILTALVVFFLFSFWNYSKSSMLKTKVHQTATDVENQSDPTDSKSC